MKPCVSSSGCEPRPGRGQPTHPGSEPCGDRGNAVADAEVRERVGRRPCSLETTSSWVPRVSCSLKATAGPAPWASRAPHPAGSTTTARWKRTARTPGRPSVLLVARAPG